jgi:hypothetical protein
MRCVAIFVNGEFERCTRAMTSAEATAFSDGFDVAANIGSIDAGAYVLPLQEADMSEVHDSAQCDAAMAACAEAIKAAQEGGEHA